MLIRDKATFSTRKKLANGFLLVDAVLARTGIQTYSAGELGLDKHPRTGATFHPTDTIRVRRSPAQVFAPASLESFSMAPVTDNHPSDNVTHDNVRQLAVGWASETITRTGDDLVAAKLLITDAASIRRVEGGKTELSNGYDCELDWSGGIIPAGERDAGQTFDAEQTGIIGNHIAIVDAGRCGADCSIQDAAPVKDAPCNCQGDEAMADKALIKKVVDGYGLVETTDEAHTVITDQKTKLDAATTALDKANGALAAKDAAHADAIKAKDDEIAKLTAQVGDTATLDARVAARTKIVTDARKVAGADLVVDGLTDAAIRKAAVAKKLGDAKVDGKSDVYIEAAFDHLVDSVADGGDDEDDVDEAPTLRDALRTPKRDAVTEDSYEARMAKRYKQEKAA